MESHPPPSEFEFITILALVGILDVLPLKAVTWMRENLECVHSPPSCSQRLAPCSTLITPPPQTPADVPWHHATSAAPSL